MSNNNQFELQQAQQKKIDNFCEIINNNNIQQAEHYLNKANWDEELAVQYFFNSQARHREDNNNINDNPKANILKRHASAKMNVKNSSSNNHINHKSNYNHNYEHNYINDKNNYVRRIHDNNNQYIEINIDNLINEKEKGSQFTHDKVLLYIKNNLKNVETNFKTFIQKLVNNAGIILIFREENLQRLKEQIIQINELKDKIQNYIIFPTSVNSEKGMDISLTLLCISFPSYIFCRYKNENELYITDKMEGAFEKAFFEACLKKISSNLNPIKIPENSKPNMKNIPKPQTNAKKKASDQIFENVFNQFRGNDNNGKNRNNDINRNRNHNMKLSNQNKTNSNNYNQSIEKKKNDYNNKENIIENKSNKNRNDNYNNYEQNNNIINNNIVDKNVRIKNEIVNNQKNKENDKNDFLYSNYGDFFLGDSMEIPKLFGIYNNNKNNNIDEAPNKYENHFENNNQNNNRKFENRDISQHKKEEQKNIFDNNNKNSDILNQNVPMLRDSIYNLSDGQVLAKREQEMRKLEKMQEEKEKKEAEEKKKILEEEKKIKKYEQEAEIAKMILAPEPDANNPDVCHIKFRLPDGEKMKERRFLKTDNISILYDYVKSIGREIFMEPDATDFNILYVGFPPKNLENFKNNTLENEGLYPNSILQISEK